MIKNQASLLGQIGIQQLPRHSQLPVLGPAILPPLPDFQVQITRIEISGTEVQRNLDNTVTGDVIETG
jgi:hypothetical protein